MKPDYDTTVARIAGNIASGFARNLHALPDHEEVSVTAIVSVQMARAIVAETKRTQPVAPVDAPSGPEGREEL